MIWIPSLKRGISLFSSFIAPLSIFLSDVEAKGNNIAVLNDIILSLQTQLPGRLGSGHGAAAGDEFFVADYLRLDESPLKILMNGGGGPGRLGAGGNDPRLDFVLADGEIGDPAEQAKSGLDDPHKGRFGHAEGSEEFLLLWFDTAPDEAGTLRDSVQKHIANLHITHAGSDVSPEVTVSGGMVIGCPDSPGSLEHFLQSADDALYRAKSAGRNQIIIRSL